MLNTGKHLQETAEKPTINPTFGLRKKFGFIRVNLLLAWLGKIGKTVVLGPGGAPARSTPPGTAARALIPGAAPARETPPGAAAKARIPGAAPARSTPPKAVAKALVPGAAPPRRTPWGHPCGPSPENPLSHLFFGGQLTMDRATRSGIQNTHEGPCGTRGGLALALYRHAADRARRWRSRGKGRPTRSPSARATTVV